MTDRIKGFYVALEEDIRVDDFETIKNAVMMIKGVLRIETSVRTIDDFYNRAQIRDEYTTKLFKVLREEDDNENT